MVISKRRQPTSFALLAIALGGCAAIVDFDSPFEGTTTGSGGSATTTTSAASSSSSSGGCTPTTSCAAAGATCGALFDGCATLDCGTCAAPLTCDGSTHTCTCASPVTSQGTLVADTKISSAAGWDCGTITSGDAPCMHLTVDPQIRGLFRFSIDGAAAAAIAKPGALLSAKLTITPADVCESTSFTPNGKLDAWVMRNDWSESEARWCHREGPTGSTSAAWGSPGANDPVLDFGDLAGSVTMPATNVPFTLDLDPKKIESSSELVVGNEISFRVVGEPGALLVMKTKEWSPSTPPVLMIEYCP